MRRERVTMRAKNGKWKKTRAVIRGGERTNGETNG